MWYFWNVLKCLPLFLVPAILSHSIAYGTMYMPVFSMRFEYPELLLFLMAWLCSLYIALKVPPVFSERIHLIRSSNSIEGYICKHARTHTSKAIPVTGLGGLWGCKMLRIPHCLEDRLTDNGKTISLTRRPHCTPQKHFFFFWYSFLLEAE
jgi:hypothetical protein